MEKTRGIYPQNNNMNILFWYTIFFASTTSYIALLKQYNPYKWFVIGAVMGAVGLVIISIQPIKNSATNN
jgi:hypothetical protein